jgi:hypothetical protein
MPASCVIQLGKGFFLGGHDRHIVPLRTRSIEHEKRETAVAGNQPKTH